MIPAERQAAILSRLSGRGVLSIAEISAMLNVSQMTVRRDIRSLEQQGRALSVAGGIQLPGRLLTEPSHIIKTELFREEKLAIGRLAASMVEPNMVIYLDAGTTILEIARLLAGRHDITVVTNDFMITAFLAQESDCKLFHTGGEVERNNQSCVGFAAGDTIRHFNFDLAFLSTSSFGPDGISTPSENKIAVKRAVAESSANRVLITDSSKYGLVGTFNALPLDALNAIITDNALSESARDVISERGVKLHLVEVENNIMQGDRL